MKTALLLLVTLMGFAIVGCSHDDPEAALQNPTANKPPDPTAPPKQKRAVDFGAGTQSTFGGK